MKNSNVVLGHLRVYVRGSQNLLAVECDINTGVAPGAVVLNWM